MIKTVLLGYAQVFFSTRLLAGFCFMLATFTVPAQGTAGTASLVMSNLWAYLLGFDKKDIQNGYYGYNGLLTGLALGLTYQLNWPFIAILAIASLLGVLVAASLQSLFRNYLFIPVLSMPFVITTWFVLAGSQLFHGLTYTLAPFESTFLSGVLPFMTDSFVRSLGSTFFQVGVVAGFLTAAGVILFSRYAFLLAVIGFFSGTLVYALLKGDQIDLAPGLVAFNFILTAVAVGGIWTVPGVEAMILAMAGSAVCAMVSAACIFLLGPVGLPSLAFPFVVTTYVIIFSLKQRASAVWFGTVPVPEVTPEKNLKRYRNAEARFFNANAPAFLLPVSGDWTITQGVDGKHTHKGLWSHAWDFEIDDEGGNAFRNNAVRLEDFYAYNMPVYAPADGKVVTVVNYIEDNPIGQVNAEHNWGNAVVIWHYGNVYTALCHLKQGTAEVSEGETVRQGQVIGRVGNSGRSVVPHLHFQAQSGPEIGAPTLASKLLHYTQASAHTQLYCTHGSPKSGDRVRPLQVEENVFETAGFPIGAHWTYEARGNGKNWTETWETEIDFTGNRFLVCRSLSARVQYMVNRYALLLLDYEGPREVGLYWFFLGQPRLPMTRERIAWHDRLPGEIMLPPLKRFLFDLVEPVYPLASLRTTSRLLQTGPTFSLETILQHRGPLAGEKLETVRVVSSFETQRSLVSLSAYVKNEPYFELKQIPGSDRNGG